MRHLRLTLLGCALLLPFGCSGDKEEDKSKSPEKTTENAANKTQNPPENKTLAKNTPPQNAPLKNTPMKNLPAGDGSALGRVPQNAVLLLSVRPSSLLESPFVKSLQIEDNEEFKTDMAKMQEKVGFDVHGISSVSLAAWPGEGHLTQLAPLLIGFGGSPPNIEQIPEPVPNFDDCNVQPPNGFDPDTAAPGGPGGANPLDSAPKFDGAIYVQFNQPVDMNQLRQNLDPKQELQQSDFQGKPIWVHPGMPVAGGPAVYQPDSRTLIITLKNDLAEILNSPGQGLLATEAGAHGPDADFLFLLNLQPLQDIIKQAVSKLPLPAQILTRFNGLSLFVDANTGIDVDLNVNTNDEQAPGLVKQLVASVATDEQIDGLMNRAPKDASEEDKAKTRKLLQSIKESLEMEVDGTRFHASLRVPESASGFIKQAMEKAEKGQTLFQKNLQNRNNLKQIGIACHNFNEIYKQFPIPNGAGDQKSQLSWRVHLLPLLEEQALYAEFKLGEPWDSAHNKALLDKMPDIFQLSDQTKPGYTQVVAPAGEGFIVDGDKTRSFRDVTDGTSNSIMVLAVKPEKAVPWTKPGGFSIDPSQAAEILGGENGKFLALFCDASVHNLPAQIDAKTLKALLTIAGGEPVNIPE